MMVSWTRRDEASSLFSVCDLEAKSAMVSPTGTLQTQKQMEMLTNVIKLEIFFFQKESLPLCDWDNLK